jgi:hypothetical protein
MLDKNQVMFPLTLSVAEAEIALQALYDLPYKTSAGLIAKIMAPAQGALAQAAQAEQAALAPAPDDFGEAGSITDPDGTLPPRAAPLVNGSKHGKLPRRTAEHFAEGE